MKYLLILVLFFLCAVHSEANAQHKVTVVVPNVKSIKGQMMVCLIADKADYLKDCYQARKTKITDQVSTSIFSDVPEGEYAISIFHDKNMDEELNTNFIGIPKEPYGFSNNPMAMFGPPSFEKCLFAVKEDMSITIKL